MAFQVSYTLPNGLSASASYWVLTDVQISPQQQSGLLTFAGYASQADFASGLPIIGQKNYQITPTQYAAFVAATGFSTAANAPAYQFALMVHDVTAQDGTMQSFFAGATII